MAPAGVIQPTGPLRSAVQPLAQPVRHRAPDRVPGERPDPGIQLGVQHLELVPDSLLGPARDLPPKTLPISGVTERDGPDIPVLRRLEVDRVLAVTPALDAGPRPEQDSSLRPTA